MASFKSKSLLDGVKSYRSPAYGLGLIVSASSVFSIITQIFSLSLTEIFRFIIDAYQEIFQTPIMALFSLLGLSIPGWVADVIMLYLLFGSALARTRLSVRPQLTKQYQAGERFFVQGREYRAPGQTWLSIRYLFVPIEFKWVEPRPKSRFVRLLAMTYCRLSNFYERSPAAMRVVIDVVFFPASFIGFMIHPVMVYQDNFQYLEDCGYHMQSSNAVTRNAKIHAEGQAWYKLTPILDFRYFFLAQLITVFACTLFFFVLNSALAQ